LGYIESRTDSNGIVTQIDPDDWQYSEGADWVDWCPERMEGSTCVYHTSRNGGKGSHHALGFI